MTHLEARPDQLALFGLDLDDGSVPFIANVGHGGWDDGIYMPMDIEDAPSAHLTPGIAPS